MAEAAEAARAFCMNAGMALNTFVDESIVNVIVESPRGSRVKLKWDPDHGVMRLSRPLPSGLSFPYDWGFIVSTLAADGDPLDAFLLWDGSSYPGLLVPSRVTGLLKVEQKSRRSGARERNDRVVAVPIGAVVERTIRSVLELDQRDRLELEQFFRAAVAFEDKDLQILGWGGPDEALAVVRESARRSTGPAPNRR